MKTANQTVFERLFEYCAARGTPCGPDAPRWVASTAAAKDLLKHLKLEAHLSLGPRRHLAWLRFRDTTDYLALVGFESEPDIEGLSVCDSVEGFEVCLFSELVVLPIGTPTEVLDVVLSQSDADSGYPGHDSADICRLFPGLTVLESRDAVDEATVWATFLQIAVQECRLGASWVDDDLATSLEWLAGLNVPSLPYKELCRSVLDLDPRRLYMELYRCIEATYAFQHASKIKAALALSQPWDEVAKALDSEMGWHPQEATSLNSALTSVDPEDLRSVCDCLGVTVGTELPVSAGRAIYDLRNQIVHFRPSRRDLQIESLDWNALCNGMVRISATVFSRAYGADL